MATRPQGSPGVYLWEPPGKPVSIGFDLEVVDGIQADVMRGFAAVPKRGAEVGGLLLGTIERGERLVVRIESFQPVACEYKHGPSWLLSNTDRQAFEEAYRKWQPNDAEPPYAVGYYRSHTREGFSPAKEDQQLCSEYFMNPGNVVLLIKPFPTKPGTGGFFLIEDGRLEETTSLEFPFRRRELTGEESSPRRARADWLPEPRPDESRDEAPAGYDYAEPAPPRRRTGGIWILLSLGCLVLGLLLGFEGARIMNPKPPAQDQLALGLSASRSDQNLKVRWDRQALAIRAARRGVLEIQDGAQSKPVPLDPAMLQAGSILFRHSSNYVRFRLEVFPKEGLSVAETFEWRAN